MLEIGTEVTDAATVKSRIVRYESGSRNVDTDQLVVEEPLEIAARNNSGLKSLGTVFRTPGDDEALALGLLRNEGVIREIEDVVDVRVKTETGSTMPVSRVLVKVIDSINLESNGFERAFPISAACGACGKSALDALRIHRTDAFDRSYGVAVTEKELLGLSTQLEACQIGFRRTGGLHAAARFSSRGELLDLAEDVGRHNALDKLAGRAMALGDENWGEQVLLFSGRVGFDLMQKTITAGCPFVACIGAPSSFAVELANLFNITLVGFLRENRFNVYSVPDRIKFA